MSIRRLSKFLGFAARMKDYLSNAVARRVSSGSGVSFSLPAAGSAGLFEAGKLLDGSADRTRPCEVGVYLTVLLTEDLF